MDRMKWLVDRLNELSAAYYMRDASPASDAEYDALYDELASLEQSTGVVLANSPTHRVGSTIMSAFEEHTHIRRLWSLDKVKTYNKLHD